MILDLILKDYKRKYGYKNFEYLYLSKTLYIYTKIEVNDLYTLKKIIKSVGLKINVVVEA